MWEEPCRNSTLMKHQFQFELAVRQDTSPLCHEPDCKDVLCTVFKMQLSFNLPNTPWKPVEKIRLDETLLYPWYLAWAGDDLPIIVNFLLRLLFPKTHCVWHIVLSIFKSDWTQRTAQNKWGNCCLVRVCHDRGGRGTSFPSMRFELSYKLGENGRVTGKQKNSDCATVDFRQ